MNKKTFNNISKIIERDSKSTTYKFALLRGVIDIIQDNSPYIISIDGRVHMPIGLLIEKWLLYYYPILESKIAIPQINGSSKLAFERQFIKVINGYKKRGGFSAFYNDLRKNGIPVDLNGDVYQLSKKLRYTITHMPMKYIGKSINNFEYSIFNCKNTKLKKALNFDVEKLINSFGSFSIPFEYYEAFKVLGSFINGQDSILFKWAEFSARASNDNLSVNRVLNEVLKRPITERNINQSKKIYSAILQEEGNVHCVWTGKKIMKYDIDHLIPFSVWKNNDLWNLLPSDSKTNNRKRDKIPSPKIIEKQKDHILYYWDIIYRNQTKRFKKEIQIALLGQDQFDTWKVKAISQLQNSCKYLIESRGFTEWEN